MSAASSAQCCRRTTRHNTHHHHLDGYPKRVTVRRPHHPFDGQSLELFSAVSHQGEIKLVLVLPDGTRARIPAAWTDLHGTPEPRPAVLASVAQLLQARAVVNALLRRADRVDPTARTSPKECTHAPTVDLPPTGTACGCGTGVGDPPCRSATGDSSASGALDASSRPGPTGTLDRGESR